MPASYRKIDYRVRPAKHIERKMLAEAFSRLHPFATVDRYQYIGFGAIYFSDFALFHRTLGINRMVSIERTLGDEERVRFNSPFGCIKVEMGESTEILPELDWQPPNIVWLDYDGRLDEDGVKDIATVLRNGKIGSVLVVSVNAQLDRGENENGAPVEVLRSRVGAAFIPPDIKADDLAGWGTARVTRRVFSNIIKEVLSGINGTRDPGNPLRFQQIVNFEYDDDAKMLTLGGIIYDKASSDQLRACEFDKLNFYRPGDDAYRIATPRLTVREIRHLDKQLPCPLPSTLDATGIPDADVEKYAQVYRYFPLFAETLV